jgi:hypothetical protein
MTLAQVKLGEGMNINEYQSKIYHGTDDATTNQIPVVTAICPNKLKKPITPGRERRTLRLGHHGRTAIWTTACRMCAAYL